MTRSQRSIALGIPGLCILLLAADSADRAGAIAVSARAADEAFMTGEICRAPVRATRGLVRLAATQTEVSPMARQAASPATAFADTDPPLWNDLGTLTYKITTRSPEAQRYFDQGLRLTYGFNHAEAQRAFRKAQRLDPDCAMCFWGEALVLGPNINLPMQQEAVAPAFAAVAKANALKDRASPRERALISALSKRYADSPPADRAALDKDYAQAMGEAAAQFPDDDNIAVLHAEALMDLSPWDYWEPGGATPRPQSAGIVPALERVLARSPDHPGAIHYYIHAVEASDRPQRAEAPADRLRGAIPGAGHLVHMPSHIYLRVGRYRDALEDNKKAAAADEKYLTETNAPMGEYRLGYYPHNVHFVLVAAQMSGEGETVIAAAEKLQSVIPDAAAREFAAVQPMKVAPYFAHAQFSAPERVLALPEPDKGMPYVVAMWHYARGVALAARGEFDKARAEANAIAALNKPETLQAVTSAGVPASDVLMIASQIVQARVFQAERNFAAAVDLYEKAAALQDKLPYMEPPYWYYPVRQSLGAALLQAGRLEAAEQQFQLSLRRAPNSAWTHYGLAELYKTRGNAPAADREEEVVRRTWTGDRRLLQVGNL